MNKILKNVINNTIEREYQSVSEDLITIIKENPDLLKDYNSYAERREEIASKLLEVVPQEYKELIEELELTSDTISGIESSVLFKKGLVLGVTELNYLTEVGLEIAFI